MNRRGFLTAAAAGSLAVNRLPRAVARTAKSGASLAYAVGVRTGLDTSPNSTAAYQGTLDAILALPTGEFPDVAGKTVLLKVNLVVSKPYTSGATTDPEAVRAVIDHCLANGASHVSIVEAGQCYQGTTTRKPPPFDICGYTQLVAGYSASLVSIANLEDDDVVLTSVPGATIYSQLLLPQLLTDPAVVIISIALPKTHIWTGATMTTKNLFGLFLAPQYLIPGVIVRGDPHLLSLNQSVVDMLLAIAPDFAIIAGVFGMHGNGPWEGPVANTGFCVAGKNPLAVDAVGVQLMGLSPSLRVMHLEMAALKGLGPRPDAWSTVSTYGDAIVGSSYQLPTLEWPYVGVPAISSAVIAAGQGLVLRTKCLQNSYLRAQIIKHDATTLNSFNRIQVVRTLNKWKPVTAGTVSTIPWDGKDQAGNIAPPDTSYLVRVAYNFGGSPPESGTWLSDPLRSNFGSTAFTITP